MCSTLVSTPRTQTHILTPFQSNFVLSPKKENNEIRVQVVFIPYILTIWIKVGLVKPSNFQIQIAYVNGKFYQVVCQLLKWCLKYEWRFV